MAHGGLSWPQVGPSWPKMGPGGPQVGPMLAHVGPCWAQVGPKLAPNLPMLAQIGQVGASWCQVGSKLALIWPQVGSCWPQVGPIMAHLPRCCQMSMKALPVRDGLSKVSTKALPPRVWLPAAMFCGTGSSFRFRSDVMFRVDASSRSSRHAVSFKTIYSNVPRRCFLLVVLS